VLATTATTITSQSDETFRKFKANLAVSIAERKHASQMEELSSMIACLMRRNQTACAGDNSHMNRCSDLIWQHEKSEVMT
jgi:hypothetical protein